MKKNSKGFIEILIIILASVILVGLLAFKSTNITKAPTSVSPTSTPESTANWKTYRNEKLGFEFKYPNSWFVTEENVLSTKTLVVFEDGKEIPNQENKMEITLGFYNQGLQRNLTLKELIEQTKYPDLARPKQSEITLGNYKGVHFMYHVHGLGYYMSYILLAENEDSSKILNISYRHDISESEPDNPNPIVLNQILSTFQFLD